MDAVVEPTRLHLLIDIVTDEAFEADNDDIIVRCKSYVDMIATPKEWAGLCEVYVLATILDMPIEVCRPCRRTSSGECTEVVTTYTPPGTMGSRSIQLLFHQYGEGTHYAVVLDGEDYNQLIPMCDHNALSTCIPLEMYLAKFEV